jgi:hypothetical protein
MVLGVLSTYFTIKRSFCKSRLTLTVTKMKNKITKYHTVKETILKSSRKINNPNTHTWPLTSLTWYMHFNKKWQGNLVSIVKWCGHASVLLVSIVKWCGQASVLLVSLVKWCGQASVLLVSLVKWCGQASVLLVSLVKWCGHASVLLVSLVKWCGHASVLLVSLVKWCGHASVLLVSLVKWCVFHMWVTRNKRTIWYDRPPQWKEQLKNIYKHGERSISSFSYNGP